MTQALVNKQDIARSFGAAAEKYDEAAHFQRWVGARLLDYVPDTGYESILDIGCGTGYFSDELISEKGNKSSCYIGLDLATDMLRFCKYHHESPQKTWLAGDAELLPLSDNTIDLAFSSLAIQWCESEEGLFKEMHRILKPGGIFVFSTLVDGSLRELKNAWAEVDMHQHVNEFATQTEYQAAVSLTDLDVELMTCETKTLRYTQVRDLTRELKMIGAHNMTAGRPSGLTGKSKIKNFLNAYEAYRLEDGHLPASYEVLFSVLRKAA